MRTTEVIGYLDSRIESLKVRFTLADERAERLGAVAREFDESTDPGPAADARLDRLMDVAIRAKDLCELISDRLSFLVEARDLIVKEHEMSPER